MAKLNQALRAKVWMLWLEGKTFSQIGKLIDPPVSKQAAHELWKKTLQDSEIKFKMVLDDSKEKTYK